MQRCSSITRSLVLFGVLLAPGLASAQDHVHQDLDVTPVFRRLVILDPATSYTFEVEGLSAGAQVALHLWDSANQFEHAFGQTAAGSLSVPFFNFSATSQIFTVIVRARFTGTDGSGTFRIRRAGVTELAQPIDFGGVRVAVPSGAHYVYQTARPPGSRADPIIMTLRNDGRLLGFDDASGVGPNARLGAALGTTHVVVASKSWSGVQRVHLYANDTGTDLDLDGLGTSLEVELGTCASPGCPGVYAANDTDRDGLTDDVEVFGIDDPADPQELPFWGADPLQKDMFVEVDFHDVESGVYLSDTDLEWLRDKFGEGSASDLDNPNGAMGVRVHFDIGRDPTDPAHAGLFGDWGGSNGIDDSHDRHSGAQVHRIPLRTGVFRYALQRKCSLGGGQADSPSDKAEWGACSNASRPFKLLHELGHTTNLQHYGHGDWGAVNCKPHYRSQMNYLFNNDMTLGFSSGEISATLRPARIRESQGIGPYAPTGYLAVSPFLRFVNHPSVDWDWSNHIAASLIRAPVTFAHGNHGCSTFTQNLQSIDIEVPIATTPALTQAFGARLYAVFVESGDLWVSWSSTSGLSNASCPGGDALGDTCTTWSAPMQIPVGSAVESAHVTFWNGALVVAYVVASGDVWTIDATNVQLSGAPVWTNNRRVRGAQATHEPHLIAMPEVAGLSLFTLDGGDYVWHLRSSVSSAFSSRGVVDVTDANGNAIVGTQSPSLVNWSNRTCGVFTDSNVAQFSCYVASRDKFTYVDDFRGAEISAKPGIAFHAFRADDGSLQGSSDFGQVWVTLYGLDPDGDPSDCPDYAGPIGCPTVPKMYASTTLDAGSNIAQVTFPVASRMTKPGVRWRDGVGIPLLENASLGALKGLYVSRDTLRFMPVADGTFDAVLRDGDDFKVMERGICLGLKGPLFCGDETTSVWGY